MNITKELSNIYRAEDCCDATDVEYALTALTDLAKRANSAGKPVRLIYARINAITKRQSQVKKLQKP